MQGKFVSFSGSTIVLEDKDGLQTPYGIMKGCKVTLNDKKAEMADLRPGDLIKLNHDPANELEAANEDDKKPKAGEKEAKAGEHEHKAGEHATHAHATHAHPTHGHAKEEETVPHPRAKEAEKPKHR